MREQILDCGFHCLAGRIALSFDGCNVFHDLAPLSSAAGGHPCPECKTFRAEKLTPPQRVELSLARLATLGLVRRLHFDVAIGPGPVLDFIVLLAADLDQFHLAAVA